ncbi:MAG: hypothetical protein V7636_1607 [Actinomycetota bacterium]
MSPAIRRRAVVVVATFLLAFVLPAAGPQRAIAIEAVPVSAATDTGWQGMAIESVPVTTTTTTAPPPAPPPARVRAASARTPRVAPPPTTDLVQRANDALTSVIPAQWLADVHPWLVLIEGSTSWSSTTGRIRVARFHAAGPYERLRAIMAHEWGHQAAFTYGTHAYLGAPPEGWPHAGNGEAEVWADCVAQTLTGTNPSGHVGECDSAALQFTRDWLARGPGH